MEFKASHLYSISVYYCSQNCWALFESECICIDIPCNRFLSLRLFLWKVVEFFFLAKFINGKRHSRSHQHKRINDRPDVSILTRHIELVVMVIFQFGSSYFPPGSCTTYVCSKCDSWDKILNKEARNSTGDISRNVWLVKVNNGIPYYVRRNQFIWVAIILFKFSYHYMNVYGLELSSKLVW